MKMMSCIIRNDEPTLMQELLNAEIQQAMEDMNASNASNVQNLLSIISGLQLNISSVQTTISSIIEDLADFNSSNSGLFDQLNTTQNYLASLDVNTTIANMIDEIDWTSIQNENDVTLRLPYMDLSNAYFVDAYLYGANFYYAYLINANLSNAYLNALTFANLTDANLTKIRLVQS